MDGIIVINKEKGYTSHDVVSKIKKTFNKKVGHTGTLDPNATGVLPILIGKATKLSAYLIEHDKEYEVTLKLGVKTTTADEEGEIIEERDVELLEEENITKILRSFIGKQMQTPPIYSAIKVNGKKLYEYARKGKNVEIAPRQIEIYDIKLTKLNNELKQINFTVKCSKGTYIRSLCEDIATKIGTVGYMKELNRTQVGNFYISDAVRVNEIEQNKENENFLKEHIITIEKFFITNKSIILDEKKLDLFINGVKLTYNLEDGIYKIYKNNEEFLGIGIIKDKLLKREIV